MNKSKPLRDNKPKPNEASGENSPEALSLPRELQEILPTIPANQRPKLVADLERLIIGIRTTYSGPLPPADAIREYNETIPNGGDRLMSMAENQMAHRHLMERTQTNRLLNQSAAGQYFALIIALVALFFSWDLAKSGHDEVAGVIGGTTVLGLVSTFIYSKFAQSKSSDNKAPSDKKGTEKK